MASTARRTVARLVVLALVATPAVAAQDEVLPEALVGVRVRLAHTTDRTASKRLSGVVVGVEGPNLVIGLRGDPPRRQLVPLSAIQDLDIHRGRSRATNDGLIGGAIVVGAVGGAFGWVGGALACDGVADCNPAAKQVEGIVAGVAVGALLGAGAGAAVGSLFGKDVWEPVRLRHVRSSLSIRPTRGGVGVALSVAF
jgi:hypothetical protein